MKKILKLFLIITFLMYTIMSSSLIVNSFNSGIYANIDSYILESMRQSKTSALTLTIVQEEQIIYQKAYQTGDFDNHLDLDTPFYIGSIGKSFTALAIKQLASKGLINIDENVSSYLDWFNLKDERGNEIRVRDLIRHRSGLSTIDGNMAYTYNANYSIEELSQVITNKVHINNIIGNINSYSNLNYIVLGAIIEKVTGLDYKTYMIENVYHPLDMYHTYHSYKEAKENGLIIGYRVINGLRIPVNVPHPEAQVPAGFQLSSTNDMTNYLIMFLNQGNFKAKSLFENNVLSSESYTYDPYWQEIEIIDGYFGHSGSTFTSTSQMIINQKEKMGILILTNSRDVSSTRPITASVISEGVIQILNGKTLTNPIPDFNWVIFSINSIFIVLLIIDLALFKRYLRMSHRYSIKRKIRFFFVDGILPFAFLYLIKDYYDVSWEFILNASPEYSFITIFCCVSFMIIAISRIIYSILRRKLL